MIDRKARLRSVVRENAGGVLYAGHVEEHGQDLFALAYHHDLEGIVAKHRAGPYISDGEETSWLPKNRLHMGPLDNPHAFPPWL